MNRRALGLRRLGLTAPVRVPPEPRPTSGSRDRAPGTASSQHGGPRPLGPQCGPGRAAPAPRRGGRGSQEAEAPLRAPTQPRCHLPRCAARPGASPIKKKRMPLPRAQTRSEPCGQSPLIRLLPTPQHQQAWGRESEEAAGPPAAGTPAPTPPPPVAATGTFVWRPLRLPRGGRGRQKSLSD